MIVSNQQWESDWQRTRPDTGKGVEGHDRVLLIMVVIISEGAAIMAGWAGSCLEGEGV